MIVTDEVVLNDAAEPEVPQGPAVQIEQRFLFVDVAALRAKQLRRGALPRISGDLPRKAERIAMREVREGFVRPSPSEEPPVKS